MRYALAIIQTIILVVMAFAMPPLFKWYSNYFGLSGESLAGPSIIAVIVSMGMLIMTVLRWCSAISDKPIKDIF